jgi:hypothetical protein
MTKKMPNAKSRSEIAGAIHETVRGMHRNPVQVTLIRS